MTQSTDEIKRSMIKTISKFDGTFVNWIQFIDAIEDAIKPFTNPEDIKNILNFAFKNLTTPKTYLNLLIFTEESNSS